MTPLSTAVLAAAAFVVTMPCLALAALVILEKVVARRRRRRVRALGRAPVPAADPYARALALARDRSRPWW
ncbi:hypothetical protein Athai_09760 [Actinocatenispora thailandica]|uniref:Uncharacterized protein n=1 Tax=Actinocatenispora thailandica TaxID=227318 RepID=A0A7R7HVV8_9ACTN|nr:hypothetical protein [Actinocatenispora thailandica]BCJ33473.1 hypothetical protein Athai_09760 [Actinocatenispora thailandica]